MTDPALTPRPAKSFPKDKTLPKDKTPPKDKTLPKDEILTKDSAPKPRTRTQDPEGVRQNILEVATAEFTEKGFSGARVDDIAAKTNTSKRMIYYYFRDKEGLYIAVLERAYATMRSGEAQLQLQGLDPAAAMRRLAQFTFTFQNANTWFVRLVLIENIHHGEHLARSERIQGLNISIVEMLRDVYNRGVAEGLFRPNLDIIDLHMTMSALAIFNVSHRATFSRIFRRDMGSPEALSKRCTVAVETLMRYVLINP